MVIRLPLHRDSMDMEQLIEVQKCPCLYDKILNAEKKVDVRVGFDRESPTILPLPYLHRSPAIDSCPAK